MTDLSSSPWSSPMSESQFARMRGVLAAPSPIGHEAAMTRGVLEPAFREFMPESWGVHHFKGHAGLVVDTHPGDTERLSVMIVGHADKIRLQVRSIGDDGKVWINSDSFLPCTLIGHEVKLFSEDPANPGAYRVLEGGTIEALGAIHFAPPETRKGDKGISPEMLYLELQMMGDNPREQVEALGIRPGNPIILNRPVRRGFSGGTFYGAYLDNGLGCFTTLEVARLVAEAGGLEHIRCLFAIATHEEIGIMGSRVLAGELKPDVLLAVDVNHDLKAAPGVGDKRHTPITMGGGFTVCTGSLVSEYLNAHVKQACLDAGIPYQLSPAGRVTGTDAMASGFASVDSAAGSFGIPVRNMHTISETGCDADLLGCIHGLAETLQRLDREKIGADDFRAGHPRLDEATPLSS